MTTSNKVSFANIFIFFVRLRVPALYIYRFYTWTMTANRNESFAIAKLQPLHPALPLLAYSALKGSSSPMVVLFLSELKTTKTVSFCCNAESALSSFHMPRPVYFAHGTVWRFPPRGCTCMCSVQQLRTVQLDLRPQQSHKNTLYIFREMKTFLCKQPETQNLHGLLDFRALGLLTFSSKHAKDFPHATIGICWRRQHGRGDRERGCRQHWIFVFQFLGISEAQRLWKKLFVLMDNPGGPPLGLK